MPNPVVHFEVQSVDADKSKAFFKDVFGWSVNNVPMPGGVNYGLVDTESAGIGINGGIGPSFSDETCVTFYIAVDDPQAYLDKAVAAGAEVLMPVTVIPDAVTMAMFKDPAGAVVGLVLDEETPSE